jgi:hypothetical protein
MAGAGYDHVQQSMRRNPAPLAGHPSAKAITVTSYDSNHPCMACGGTCQTAAVQG